MKREPLGDEDGGAGLAAEERARAEHRGGAATPSEEEGGWWPHGGSGKTPFGQVGRRHERRGGGRGALV